MALYDLYVGTASHYRAHNLDYSRTVEYLEEHHPGYRAQRVWGVWDGAVERTDQFTLDLPTDAVAERVATALSVLTGNDCVLVTRLAGDSDRPAGGFGNRDKFRVATVTRTEGDRTLYSEPTANLRTGDVLPFYGTVTHLGTMAGFATDENGVQRRFTREDVAGGLVAGKAGTAYVPNRDGDFVAFLAWQNGTISPVTA